MRLNNKQRWYIDDPDACMPLYTIEPLSRRVRTLVARSNSKLLESAFVQLWGAISMLTALDYHFANFMAALRVQENKVSKDYQAVRDEAIAWINRAGQFHYFMRSDLVRAEPSMPETPTLDRLMMFRNKHAAHRSIDAPRKQDTADLQFSHALAISDLSGTLWQSRFPDHEQQDCPDLSTHMLSFQLRSTADSRLTFTLEQDHPLVMEESYRAIEWLLARSDG